MTDTRENRLTAYINDHFKPGDVLAVLTYRDGCTPDEAQKHLAAFIDKIKPRFGRWTPAVSATEAVNGTVYHEVLIHGVSPDKICAAWKLGKVQTDRLSFAMSEHYARTYAKYLLRDKTVRIERW